ncbi:MAG: clostripain-related cysteine peptidase [Chloroflexi bacterium]|nr:clostripain-related cysteine peptidase [Chloroflexota bacterium]
MTPETVRRPWTFMVYMAGDNGKILDSKLGKIKLMDPMEAAGYTDLMKMGTIGTTANVAVACLFDTPTDTYLIEVRQGRGFSDSAVRRVPAVNTGDPNTLRQFVVQAIKAYPADHYALVIWNHGAGWLDTDVYAITRSDDPDAKSHGAIFRTTPQQITGGDKTRPIAFDDSSKDFLDTADLRKALGEAEKAAGARLDVIGMDACLMAMVEGAIELAPYGDYFVASQEVEPMYGWPYAPILQALDSQPSPTPAALAEAIVTQFAGVYGGKTRDETVTQSAVALARTAATEKLCKALVDGILADKSPALRTLIRKARKNTLTFQDRNYCDLGDFAGQIASQTEFEDYDAVAQAAAALRDHLTARGPNAPVLRVGFLDKYERANGLSVYVPPESQAASQRQAALKLYRGLAFAQHTGWDRLVEWLYDEF